MKKSSVAPAMKAQQNAAAVHAAAAPPGIR